MSIAEVFKQYLEHLFAGKRCEAREHIFNAQDRGVAAWKLLKMVVWPAMEQLDKLYRAGHINILTQQMAIRINRMVADQLHLHLARKPKTGKRMIIACGKGEIPELGAQVLGDLFEAEGWHVWLLGSEVPADEIVKFAAKISPDVLAVYGALPEEAPSLRQMVELFREVGVCDDMQILMAGGVFARAEGLHEEIKADLYAADLDEALRVVVEHPVRVPKPDVPQPGRRRKRRRRTQHSPAVRALKEELAQQAEAEKND